MIIYMTLVVYPSSRLFSRGPGSVVAEEKNCLKAETLSTETRALGQLITVMSL